MKELYRLSSLAIMGMGKNTGKTSFLNILIKGASRYAGGRILALTSIGRDGEERDLVTRTGKPRIYIPEGTLVATAEELLVRCDVTREILKVTEIYCALGRIVIFRALSDGYVELAGPSRSQDLLQVESIMRSIEKDCLFLVDGALSRMSISTRTQGAVLCTGVSLSRSMDRILEMTKDALSCLTLKKTTWMLPEGEARAYVKQGEWIEVQGEIALSLGKDIGSLLEEETEGIFIRGAVTDMLIKELSASPHFRNLTLMAKDGTRFILSHETLNRLEARGVTLQAAEEIKIRAVIVNPFEAGGDEVNIEGLLRGLREETTIPIYSLRDFGGRST